MEKNLHPVATGSTANFSWLQTKYSFSFTNYLNSNRMQLGLPDVLKKNKTFGNHDTNGIRNSKIVTNAIEEDSRALLTEVSLN